MTEYVREWEDVYRALVNEVLRGIEFALQPFANSLDAFLAELFSARLPSDWRERWHAFVAEQAELGFFVEPVSVEELETWIEQWAKYCGLLPVEQLHAATAWTKLVTSESSPSGRFDRASFHLVSGSKRRGRIPRNEGKWDGRPGVSTWKPQKPIVLSNGVKVESVLYRNGMPVFDKWSIGEVTIVLTGQHEFDRGQAIRDWNANGAGQLPKDYVFHHDGLTTKSIKYKSNTVVVGRMQLIPRELNQKLPHLGSASIARRLTTADPALARKLANEIDDSALSGKGPLAKFSKRLKTKLARSARRVGRLLPIVGGALVIWDFTENAKAHGVGGGNHTWYTVAWGFGHSVRCRQRPC